MGRSGNGIEIRGESIRLSFTLHGKRERQLLLLNGKPLAPTAANLKYATRLAGEIREKIRHGTFVMSDYFSAVGGGLTVAGQLDAWLLTQRIEASTKAGYSSAVKFWKEAGLGARPLRALVTSDVLTVIAARPDLTGKTINNYVSVLREAISLAVTDKALTDNPVAKVEAVAHQKEPPDPFSRDEAEAIIAAVKARHPAQLYNFVEFWMFTGLRTSEIFGLKWDNVDLSGSILVSEAVVRGVHKNNTKTNKTRTVKLNSRALAAIQRQRQHTQMASGAVFNDPRYGQPWIDERAFRRSYWTPTLKILGVRYRRPYNMRHTYATMMLMAGMNHSYCAGQLGHSVEMFQRTYSKWLDGEQNNREMERLEKNLLPQICPKKATL